MSILLSKDDQQLADAVRAFGCPGIISLRNKPKESPEHIPYLDLLSAQVQREAVRLPDAVAEFQGRPVMYLVDGNSENLGFEDRIELQLRLANRGDHAVLVEVRPGELTVHPLNLDRKALNTNGLGRTFRISDARAPFLFQDIATGTLALEGSSEDADPVFEEIKRLLNRAVKELVIDSGLDGLDVLSMTGRALFFRFLIDREIVTDDLIDDICPAAGGAPNKDRLRKVFSNPERAAQTSAWLDITFNGDLLPLFEQHALNASDTVRTQAYLKAFEKAGKQTGNAVFHHMEAILRGWEHVDGITQPCLPGIDWHQLNFRHIPIGVLSQVYENFSHQVDSKDSSDRSVHYTPRSLAKLLVDEALAGLETPAHQAKILDPACGAGVFLVLALRELVRRRWEADKARLGDRVRRPSKQVIESILHHQIRGFDVSESALRLAALALYVTVIELNEITRPPSEHHASKALQGLVLFDQRTQSERTRTGFVLGSLGEAVDSATFDGVFDVVVGNPPWSIVTDRVRSTELNQAGTQIGRRILSRRGLTDLAGEYQNPGGVPDLPFLWRGAEWAKEDGIVAFALDARLILKQTPIGLAARNALFQAIQVTGILNGSDLEKTPVWGCHDQPWILLWCRNRKPDLTRDAFHLATPVREDELAARGEFRLDYKSAYQITIQSVLDIPWLCKALAIGSTLDVQVMEKLIRLADKQSIGSFWENNNLECGNGFSLKRQGKKEPPAWLKALPVFDNDDAQGIPSILSQTFDERYPERLIESPRIEALYAPPLLIIPESLGGNNYDSIAHRIKERKVCFSKSFFGYSACGHADSELIISLLMVIVHSALFRHFCYMRSSRVGAGRRTIYKIDIDSFPFPDLEAFTNEQRTEALQLADMLDTHDEKDWTSLNSFVSRLFGLNKDEQQVVIDTVTFNGPYATIRRQSMCPVPKNEAKAFACTLERAIQPFFKAVGQKVKATLVPRLEGAWQQPWAFVTLLFEGDVWSPSDTLIASLIAEASASAASRVVMPLPDGGLIVGLLNRRRFWTQSRARLCALHLIHEHLDRCFPMPSHA